MLLHRRLAYKLLSANWRPAKREGFALAILTVIILGFLLGARAQQKPCCSITAINTDTDMVAAKANTTGEVFEFKVTNPALLRSLKVGDAIYANFTTRQVSVDAKNPCGRIVSIGPHKGSQTPNAPSTSAPPAPPGNPPKPAAGTPPSGPAPAPSGANLSCCSITSINVQTRVVVAKVTSTGQGFDFSLPNSLPIQDLQVGQSVWANFKLRQVSLNGLTSCCPIISVGAWEVATAPGTAPPSAPGDLGLPTPTSVVLTPASVTGGASPTGTVNLTGAAPQGGIQVGLATSDAVVATVPQSVVVAEGASSGTFTVSTRPVPLQHAGKTFSDTSVPVVVSASTAKRRLATVTQAVTQSATLDVLPPVVENLEGYPSDSSSFTSLNGRRQNMPCAGAKGAKLPFSRTGDTPTQACVLLSGPAANEPQQDITPIKIRGAEVALSSSNPQIAKVPATVVVPEGRVTEQFAITTVPVRTPTSVVISAQRIQSDTKTLQITVLPPVLQDFQCTPQNLTGGSNFSCTVTLTGPAFGGLVVQLDRNCDPLMTVYPTVPSIVAFAPGSPTATFSFSTIPVATDLTATIKACFGSDSKSASLTIQAPRPLKVGLYPSSVPGGTSSSGRVTVNGRAPQQGMYITLKSDNPTVAAVPASVHLGPSAQQYAFSDPFTIQTSPVAGDTTVTISASYDSTAPTASSPFTVKAPPPAPLPDLYVSFPFYADSASCASGIMPSPGQTTSFTFYLCIIVGNKGNAPAGATKVTGTMSSDNSTVQFAISVPALSPGQSGVLSTSTSIVASSGVEYAFTACVNRDQSIKESNYVNNCAAWQLGVGF